jgi:hypothetical protein
LFTPLRLRQQSKIAEGFCKYSSNRSISFG